MAGRAALGSVMQAVAHDRHLTDLLVQFVRLGDEGCAFDARAIRGHHGGNLVQLEARCAAKRDEAQTLQHIRIEQTSETAPPCGCLLYTSPSPRD